MTKGGYPNLNTMNINLMSKQEMQKDLNNSLSKIGTDYIDIYFYHLNYLLIPVGEFD
ncbi:aldo/keto reductase [Brevinema andersonii]|uniref:aldo/keto reductase n=1 Tax=Brevinema andersonii TaxID=34097 RepID=UPI0011784B95|nr:aldo/keto reductase [Brevinema andersonii]